MGLILFLVVAAGVYGIATALGADWLVATIAAWVVALTCSFFWFKARQGRRY